MSCALWRSPPSHTTCAVQYEALGMISHYKVYEDLNTDY